MKQDILLNHEFVEFIPGDLQPGTIYISMRFGTAVHLCVCGCGSKVVTPLRPTDWKLIFDGKTVSLDPSIGNWSFQCQSHYWVQNNKVRWAPQWSKNEIDAARAYDKLAKDEYFASAIVAENDAKDVASKVEWRPWRRLRRWWSGHRK